MDKMLNHDASISERAVVTASLLGADGVGLHPQPVELKLETTGLTATRVVLIDSDEMFRDSLCLGLPKYGMSVMPFAATLPALKYFSSNNRCDVVLVDLEVDDRSGLAFLAQLRRSGIRVPVIVLTDRAGQAGVPYEEAALESGADDFLDKSRGLTILAKRIGLIARRSSGLGGSLFPPQNLEVGPLRIAGRMNRVQWRGTPVALTVTEIKIVHLLAMSAGEPVSYRDIYDLVHGVNFVAGNGGDGYRTNVRSTIKRIRKKFAGVDATFSSIENFPSYGYCWR